MPIEQEGAVEMIKAVKLVNVATDSISDLSRAQRTDFVTDALGKRMEVGPLKGTPHKTKPLEDQQNQLDAEVRKIVTDIYEQWKGEYVCELPRYPVLPTKTK